jgi:endoglucanase
MKFTEVLVTAATLAGAVAAPMEAQKKRASKFQFVGVNESGAEFGNTALPGRLDKDYTWPSQSAITVSLPIY